MRRWCIALFAVSATALAQDAARSLGVPFVAYGTPNPTAQDAIRSPDGRFVAYRTPNPTHGIGKRLFVTFASTNNSGRLLLENDRNMDAQWSPDSKFLAVTNYTDPHITVVLVFQVSDRGSMPDARLVFISPDPGAWDTKWFVSGWDTSHRTILLEKRVAGEESQAKKRFRIGTKALELPH
jgi:dipeptidyl aminopeptidase/acylaminoacyl peptidase